MKEIDELNLPDDIRYSTDHEWGKMDGDIATIGISDFAQDQLGDIVFVELPEVGDSFEKDDEFGTLESVKAVSEMFLPMAGQVTEINDELGDSPELVNSDTLHHGSGEETTNNSVPIPYMSPFHNM